MSKGFPQNRHEMKRAGYEFKSHAKCKSCSAAIEWWKTTNSKMIPIDALAPDTKYAEDVPATPHWATCTKADEHRAPKPAVTHRRELTIEQEQERAVELLASQLKARVLVAILADGTFRYSIQRGIPAEDVRHELITLANNLRRDLEAQQ